MKLAVVGIIVFLTLIAAARARAQSKSSSAGVSIGMVMLTTGTLPDAARLADAHRQSFPDAPLLANAKTGGNTVSFDLGGMTAVVAMMPAPIPWADIEGPASTAYWWPDAEAQAKKHSRHLIVTIAGPAESQIHRALAATRLTSAVLQVVPDSIGVYWGAGTLVVPPNLWIESSKTMTREVLPLDIWIDFRMSKQADGRVSCFTTGMRDFSLMELEVEGSKRDPGQVREYVWNAAHYLLDNGPVLLDGQTFGFSATDKIGIRHAPSMWPGRSTVIKLGL